MRLTSLFSQVFIISGQSLIFFGFQAEVCGTGLSIEIDTNVLFFFLFVCFM